MGLATLLSTEDEALMLCGLCFLDCLNSFEKGVTLCNVGLGELSDEQESTLRILLSLFSRLHATHFHSFIGPLYTQFASAVNYLDIPEDFASSAVTTAFVGECIVAVLWCCFPMITRREAAQQLTVKEWEMSASFVTAIASLLRLNDVGKKRAAKA